VDVDPDTIAYARRTYPDVSFHCASATGISSALPGPFDAFVMFTSFYCFPDQEQALRECRALARAGAEMRVFDYTTPSWTAPAREFSTRYARSGSWKPLVIDEAGGTFARGGWHLTSHVDLTGEFRRWYRELLVRIDDRREQIVRASDEDWYHYARQRYEELLAAIEAGTVGGGLLHARLL
jgi:SAM-dependent methyltransferase